jgi:hypothetical protein
MPLKKNCKCGNEFDQYLSTQTKCTKCLIEKGKQIIRKVEHREFVKLKNHVRSTDKKKLAEQARRHCHYWIKQRDKNLPCISCGTKTARDWHASHYYDSGQFSGLRYDETNIHKSCEACNTHLHGNKSGYRVGLIKRYGLEYVLELEAKKDSSRLKKWTAEELTQIKNHYKQQSINS